MTRAGTQSYSAQYSHLREKGYVKDNNEFVKAFTFLYIIDLLTQFERIPLKI